MRSLSYLALFCITESYYQELCAVSFNHVCIIPTREKYYCSSRLYNIVSQYFIVLSVSRLSSSAGRYGSEKRSFYVHAYIPAPVLRTYRLPGARDLIRPDRVCIAQNHTHLRPRVRRQRRRRQQRHRLNVPSSVARPRPLAARTRRGRRDGPDRIVPADRPTASTRPSLGLVAIAHGRWL